ncbi:MAG: hypothetical protein PHI58_03765 [Candidatus Omnitrophica bacterium]|nr:hypothetical protein [Candidatus Omnitrophota bacterium]
MTNLKKAAVGGAAIALFFLQNAICAQTDYDKNGKDVHKMTPENINEVRPGMEVKKIGGINMVVPEGTQFYMEGSQVKMEEAGEYAARRFKSMTENFKALEDKVTKLEERVLKLEKARRK